MRQWEVRCQGCPNLSALAGLWIRYFVASLLASRSGAYDAMITLRTRMNELSREHFQQYMDHLKRRSAGASTPVPGRAG